MITAAINLMIYCVLTLIVGLYKPKWALFWMKKPDRFSVVIFAGVLFMVAATLFGEGNRRKHLEPNQLNETAQIPASGTSDKIE